MRKINWASVIFGAIFVAMGVFLLVLDSSNIVVKIIAGADILFGVVLAISGFVSGGSAEDRDIDREVIDGEIHYGDREQLRDARDRKNQPEFDEPAPAAAAAVPLAAMSLEELTAEEFRLRREARAAAQEAEDTLKEAKRANAEAKAAERELNEADERARQLIGVEQQQAFKEVDRLAAVASELAQKAAVAKKRAKVAAKTAQIAADKHAAAVDAAAEAMGDDFGDDDEF